MQHIFTDTKNNLCSNSHQRSFVKRILELLSLDATIHSQCDGSSAVFFQTRGADSSQALHTGSANDHFGKWCVRCVTLILETHVSGLLDQGQLEGQAEY